MLSWAKSKDTTIESKLDSLIEMAKTMGQGQIDAAAQLATLTTNFNSLSDAINAYMAQEAKAIASLQQQLANDPTEDGVLEDTANSMAALNTKVAASLAALTAALPAPAPVPDPTPVPVPDPTPVPQSSDSSSTPAS